VMTKETKKLHVEDVYKQYDDNLVLDNVDLSVGSGEFCSLVGPSGCGKSTLLRLILGQEAATSGDVYINGSKVGVPDTSRGIVYQKYPLFDNLTVLENVKLGKVFSHGQWWNPFAKNKHKEFDEIAMHFLKRVRLEGAAHKYPKELSGGMQQRVAIAQALIVRPPILLMDEPFGALDPDTRDELQLFLLELWEEEKLTIFFVTHDLVEACFLGSRLLVLSQYYSDDRGSESHIKRGGRIVADYQISSAVSSTQVKSSSNFRSLIENVRNEGFNPEVLQHVKDFNLKHPDSFQTI
jgi:NitT/TauT family transport system ATP-binding protein